MWRSAAPSKADSLIVERNSIVLVMRARSSASVFSSSACTGASVPVSLAAPPLALSQAIWTCLFRGNMSAARRDSRKAASSRFFSVTKVCAFPKRASSAVSDFVKTGMVHE